MEKTRRHRIFITPQPAARPAIESRSSRRLLLGLLWLSLLPQTALASSASPIRKSVKIAYNVVAYRYHTAECRYLQNPAMDMLLAAAKLSPAPAVASSLVSCMEPGYLQWT